MLGSVAPWALSAIALALAGRAEVNLGSADTWHALALLGFSLLVALNTLLISPAYTAAGLYHPLLLATAFLAARRFSDRAMMRAVVAALGMGVCLSLWGLTQVGVLGTARAHAMFETPATLAAVLNVLLVPLLGALLAGKRSAPLLAAAFVLAAAVCAAESRGGLLALTAGLGLAVILARRAGFLRRDAVVLVLALLGAGWIASTGLRTLSAPKAEVVPNAEMRAESSISRLELYTLSWNAWRERPLAGTGYLTFRYTLERGRESAPSYGDSNETWFVHNDYLQTLQELGPAGLLAFLGITWLPPLFAYRSLPRLRDADRPMAVMLSSAMVTMPVHALVDFPFYVPVCLLLYGAMAGVLDRRISASNAAPAPGWTSTKWYLAARAAVLALAGVMLMRPVLAETAAEWGLRKAAAGDGQGTALWLGAAQRIDPRDWRYHWYAGQFWDAQAAQSGNREAARLAAEAYAAGFAANPLEVRNLLGKIAVHRRHRGLLDSPADPRTLQDWLAQAAALAPLNPAVRREIAR